MKSVELGALIIVKAYNINPAENIIMWLAQMRIWLIDIACSNIFSSIL